MKKEAGNIILILITGILLFSCDRDRNHPGYTYYPDMVYSRAYETNGENPVFDDGLTMRLPVEGTVPRGFIPFPYVKNDTDMVRAGKELQNPLNKTNENVKRGELVFQRYCIDCHGEKGDGKGHLFTSGLYPYPPASLVNDKMKNKPDGEMYHQITLGWGIMGPYGLQIRPEDRWKVIVYLREELQKQ